MAETSPRLSRLISRDNSGDQEMACSLTKATPRATAPDKVKTNSPWRRLEVTATSPRRLLRYVDVSPVKDKISLRDVAGTDGNIAETSPRDLLETDKSLQKSNMFEFPATPQRPR